MTKTQAEIDAEIAAEKKWMDDLINTLAAIRARHPEAPKPNQDEDPMERMMAYEQMADEGAELPPDIESSMSCPVCTAGELAYRISSYNGHIWAKCSTADCIAFMQ